MKIILPLATLLGVFLFSQNLQAQEASPQPTAQQAQPQEREDLKAVIKQVRRLSAAIPSFRDAFGAYPGDLANAGARLPACPGTAGAACNPPASSAGDGIVGDPFFASSLQKSVPRQVSIPAFAASDESILFWTHLLLADLFDGVGYAGLQAQSPIGFGTTHPATADGSGAGFIVGYVNNATLPTHISGGKQPLYGHYAFAVSKEVLMGAEMNISGMQAFSPQDAAYIDKKLDDGKPHTGFVIGYGSPLCFDGGKNAYAPYTQTRECGMAFRIE